MADITELHTPCDEWDGSRLPGGYGYHYGGGGGIVYAHREAWEKVNGPIPKGMYVLHRCDNPPCVAVEHLFLGTQEDNMADRRAKGRGSRKVTEAQVQEIRAMWETGFWKQREIAEQYGVSRGMIGHIVCGRSWK
jgi:HNH endonuclease